MQLQICIIHLNCIHGYIKFFQYIQVIGYQ